jgi:RimJ/RimL family protein N-acetyltransferase
LTTKEIEFGGNIMTANCIVRRLEGADAQDWAVLRREALETHPLAFGSSVPNDPQLLVEFILARLDTPEESAVFGAFIDNTMVGIIGIRRDTGKKELHKSSIWGMYVNAKNRRSGIGKMLLDATIQEARSYPGVEQVGISVSDVATDAKKLYEKVGFQAWGTEPHALYWDGCYADEIYMILKLQ